MKKLNFKIIAIIALTLSITSFSLPREFFDPHIIIDTDIFCKAYCSMNSGLMDKEEVAINYYISVALIFIKIHSLHSAYLKEKISIRAPPVII